MGSYFDLAYLIKSFPVILSYVDTTLIITLVAAVIGMAIGSLVAFIRINQIAV
ncbi:MAG TPA: amino acid ABC transporter permease, partial [Sporomusaceae bacterium]|nr:amino acid ABC transporter permease [Sporomusaceae bacterium]